jgi:hypothetical protein
MNMEFLCKNASGYFCVLTNDQAFALDEITLEISIDATCTLRRHDQTLHFESGGNGKTGINFLLL